MPVTIRGYRPEDLEKIKRLHEKQGLDYQMPDVDDPVFALSAIAEGPDPSMALFGKVTAEMFLFIDPEAGDPESRWQTFLKLHEAVRLQAVEAGLADVNFWLPPDVPEGFVRKLKVLGWKQDRPWKTFTFNLR